MSPLGSDLQVFNIIWGNGLVTYKGQAITSTNEDPVQGCLYRWGSARKIINI